MSVHYKGDFFKLLFLGRVGCWFLVTLLSFPGSRTQVWLFEEEGVGLEGGRFLCGVKQIVPPEQVF